MGGGQGQNKGERADRASGGNLVLSKTVFRSLRRLSEEIEFGDVLRNQTQGCHGREDYCGRERWPETIC